jgi:prepilin-type processing-associated H-X9-DG protein
MALGSATDEEDRRTIVSFWDGHVPIMMAPDGDYDCLAIAVGEERRGSVVHGCAPEWEEVDHAESFGDWLAMLSSSLRDPASVPNSPLALRLMNRRTR